MALAQHAHATAIDSFLVGKDIAQTTAHIATMQKNTNPPKKLIGKKEMKVQYKKLDRLKLLNIR